MQAHPGLKYQRARCVAEGNPRPPSEAQLQALWFEQWMRPRLVTDEGRWLDMIQPGLWNHGAGPDFFQAAYRDERELRVGPVELHVRAMDWEAHGHHVDPAYDATILHGVWAHDQKQFFPATRSFRRVPQVFLREQLIAPWELLEPALPDYGSKGVPAAQAGRCQRFLVQIEWTRALEILRAAGWHRLCQKTERWRWRRQVVGATQTLWEALAEGLGYHRNQIPFRLLAQRLPWAELKSATAEQRLAVMLGLAGLLPQRDMTGWSPASRRAAQALWERWWKVRDEKAHGVLPKKQWRLAGVRPLNRPERRLAALAQLAGVLGRVEKAVAAADGARFAMVLRELADPFWSRHATWRSAPSRTATKLLGEERIEDLLVNVFWPLVWLENPARAQAGLAQARLRPNQATEIARQRVVGTWREPKVSSEALIQQGLLQIYKDFCLTDSSRCGQCSFPELMSQWDFGIR